MLILKEHFVLTAVPNADLYIYLDSKVRTQPFPSETQISGTYGMGANCYYLLRLSFMMCVFDAVLNVTCTLFYTTNNKFPTKLELPVTQITIFPFV